MDPFVTSFQLVCTCAQVGPRCGHGFTDGGTCQLWGRHDGPHHEGEMQPQWGHVVKLHRAPAAHDMRGVCGRCGELWVLRIESMQQGHPPGVDEGGS